MRSHDIGDVVEVGVRRGDEDLTLEVTLGSDEALQEQQQNESDQTVNVNGQNVSLEDLIRLYEQYQQEQSNPFGGQ